MYVQIWKKCEKVRQTQSRPRFFP